MLLETKLVNDKSAARQLAALPHADLDAVGLEQIGVIPAAWRDDGTMKNSEGTQDCRHGT
jgi:hypothetical protein